MSPVYDAQGHEKVAGYLIEPGTIIIFYGTAVPSGWAICDGTGGTPDLTDRILVGDSAVGTGTAGGTASPATGLVHTAFALGNHSSHVIGQPAAHSAHTPTQPAAHSAHTPVQPATHATHSSAGAHTHNAHTMAADGSAQVATNKYVGPGTHSSDGAHTHDAHPAHTAWAVDAHSAHSGFAVDAHSAHAGAALDAHSVHSITQADTHQPKFYSLVYIMKI